MTESTTETESVTEPGATLPLGLNRRRVLVGAGLVAAAGVVGAACSDDDEDETDADGEDGGGSGLADTPTEGDAGIAAFAASLELLAVNTYGLAINAANMGALGEVPPAVVEFVTVAAAQHQAALDAWNTVTGTPAAATPPDLQATVDEMFMAVTDVTGAARLALLLEQIAAATYLDTIAVLESKPAIDLVGSIIPATRQHIAILHFVLGEYPVPESFGTITMSAVPA